MSKNERYKKIAVCLVVLTICIISLFSSGCIGRALSKNFARDIQKNSNFEFGILQEITEESVFEDYYVVPGFGITGYVDKKYGENYDKQEISTYVQYSVSSWPDVLSKKKYITGIDCHDEKYTLYGLKIGDAYEEWQRGLKEKGFKEKDGRFYYNCIRINVNHRNGLVFSFSIFADSTNFSGVQF